MSEFFPVVEATGKLPPQGWMTAPATQAVIAALQADGTQVRFIGGCVRDALLQRPVKDIDIATPDPPERVTELLERAGIRALPTGLSHGTVTAVIGDDRFEVTTLRVDVETDGRHARVAFTDDWIADAQRRDFTINTFSATPDGSVFDPFDSLGDLSHGRVRFVGNATQRIDEDVLRILRYFRFFAHYGRPPANAAALAACRLRAERLANLSGERVRGELLSILHAPEPAEVFLLMRGERVLRQVLPEVGDAGRNIGRLRSLTWLETRALRIPSVQPETLRRLAALVDTDAAGIRKMAERLRLSNEQRDCLTVLVEPSFDVVPGMDEVSRRRALHGLGADRFRDRVLIGWAAERAVQRRRSSDRTEAWKALIAAADAWEPVAFPLQGRDAMALGLVPGPAIGRALAAVESWWEQDGCRAGPEACLDRLRAEVADPGIGGNGV